MEKDGFYTSFPRVPRSQLAGILFIRQYRLDKTRVSDLQLRKRRLRMGGIRQFLERFKVVLFGERTPSVQIRHKKFAVHFYMEHVCDFADFASLLILFLQKSLGREFLQGGILFAVDNHAGCAVYAFFIYVQHKLRSRKRDFKGDRAWQNNSAKRLVRGFENGFPDSFMSEILFYIEFG